VDIHSADDIQSVLADCSEIPWPDAPPHRLPCPDGTPAFQLLPIATIEIHGCCKGTKRAIVLKPALACRNGGLPYRNRQAAGMASEHARASTVHYRKQTITAAPFLGVISQSTGKPFQNNSDAV
jgi:hypothetical protein